MQLAYKKHGDGSNGSLHYITYMAHIIPTARTLLTLGTQSDNELTATKMTQIRQTVMERVDYKRVIGSELFQRGRHCG